MLTPTSLTTVKNNLGSLQSGTKFYVLYKKIVNIESIWFIQLSTNMSVKIFIFIFFNTFSFKKRNQDQEGK